MNQTAQSDDMLQPLDPSILRAYDIRGVVGKTLSEEDAYAIGRAFATMVVARSGKMHPKIAIGFDGRLSSPAFEEAASTGMEASGAEVLRIGRGPTPMLYFAVRSMELDGGMMITGSHNPPDYNGFKLMYAKAALFGEEIQALGDIVARNSVITGKGSRRHESVFDDYVIRLLSEFDGIAGKKLKVAWDAGNGAAGEVMAALVKRLPGEHVTLFAEIDGKFPNHHPDPSVEQNLLDLKHAVREQGCDLGIAFDGDGDRVGVIDAQGRVMFGDQLMQLYADDVLSRHPGATIIADVKASQVLFDAIEKLGGKPMIWKTGHSFIKAKMAETGALLAGEMSGHTFFADGYYGFDDGLYAAVRIVKYLMQHEKSLAELIDALPKVHNTAEMRIDVADERKFVVIEEVQARLRAAGTRFSDIDGVRVMTDYGWWLLRASNTQPALVARCEATNPATLADMEGHLRKQLELSGVELKLVEGH